jgi:hypothetical protein
MHPQKLAFSDDVIRVVHDVCKLVFNLQSDAEITRVFGLTHEQMTSVIQKIITELPDAIFTQKTPQLEEIKHIFAREFIFFQVQERLDNPHYEEDLNRFIAIFSRDIQQRFEIREDSSIRGQV